jgi:cobalamin synthase
MLMQIAGRVCASSGGCVSKSARKDGMGKPFIDGMNGIDLLIVFFCACALTAVVIGAFDRQHFMPGLFSGIGSMLLTVPFGILIAKLIGRIFDGITGDTLGFLYEIGEIFFLVVFYRFMVIM